MTSTFKGLIPGWVIVALAVAVVAVAAIAALATSSQPAAGGGEPISTITVDKEYPKGDENEAPVTVTLVCDEGVEFTPEEADAAPDEPAEFDITAAEEDDTCDAVEVAGPTGYTPDVSDCVELDAWDGDDCVIFNILNETTITVHKTFADDDDDNDDKNDNGNDNGNNETAGENGNDELVVEILLVCPEHVTVEPDTIVEATEDKKTGVWTAEFHVSFFNPGDTCTATEVPIEGWIGFSVDCIDMDLMPEDDDKNDNGNGNGNNLAGETKNGIECLITNLPSQTQIWGDVDCNGAVSIGDAVKIARALLKLSVDQEEGCPEIGAEVVVVQAPVDDDKNGNDENGDENGNGNGKPAGEDENGEVIVTTEIWGDVDCNGDVVIGDAVKVARWLLDLSVDQEENCPEIGQEVLLGIIPPDDDDDDDDDDKKNGEKEE